MSVRNTAQFSKKSYWESLWRDLYNMRYLFLLLLPGIVFYIIFSYKPMGGLLLAFKKYNAQLGILGSPFIGLSHFERLTRTPEFITALKNTFIISIGRLIIEFPFPILLAIMLSEIRIIKMKRIYQTILTFPYFLSWVIIGGILTTFFNSKGPLNYIVMSLGGERMNILADMNTFRGFLFGTSIWKSAGWSCIIYLAAIAGINPELIEAAIVDGAGRLRCIWHITLPGIKPTIIVLFILQAGNVMNAGFDQIFNVYNPAVYPVTDILDTYVYRITFKALPDYGFSTAVGLFKSVINFIFLLTADRLSKIVTGSGFFA